MYCSGMGEQVRVAWDMDQASAGKAESQLLGVYGICLIPSSHLHK